MQASQLLKSAGLKITVPRLRVLQILEEFRAHHLSAEEVYKALLENGDDIGLATVYRVLTQFETAGLVIRHHFESDRWVFELSQGAHHDHLVCIQCGKIEEFMDEIIEKRQQVIAKKANFKMTNHALNIYGICVLCQQKQPKI